MIEAREASRMARHEFNRCWAKVVCTSDASGVLHLALRSHGKEVMVGKCLTSEAKEALAKELRIHLSN